MMCTDEVGTNHHIEYTSEDNRVIYKCMKQVILNLKMPCI